MRARESMPISRASASRSNLLGMSLSKAARVLAATSAKGGPKPLEPAQALKPSEGYFDEAFALEPGGARLYLVRTDGATFAKLEVVELANGKTTSSFDLPKGETAVERLEPLPDGKGVVLFARAGTAEPPALVATLLDGAGKAVA